MIPRLKPRYGWAECLAAVALWRRREVNRYERAFASKFGCREAVMFSHGRSGLYALLDIWGLEGTEIICPAYTCVVVPNAIVLSGNTPVFVDCAANGFNMDLEALASAVTERTRAIVATHLFGFPMDADVVDEIARSAERRYGHKIYVIHDCAHSYGARWNGGLVTARGDAAIFGSNISKIINSIFGGMVTTNHAATAEALRAWRAKRLRPAGWSKELRRFAYFLAVFVAFNETVYSFVNWLERHGAIDRFVKYYDQDRIEFPNDWDQMPAEIEARIGLAQLQRYEAIVDLRRRNALSIIRRLEGQPGIRFLGNQDGATYSHLVALADDRGKWIAAARERGIQLGTLIEYVVPGMAAYGAKSGFPVAESYQHRAINFPLHRPGMVERL